MFDKKAYQIEWRKNHPERLRELNRRWRQNNMEKSLVQEAAGRIRNKARILERNRAYRRSRPEMTRWNSLKSSSKERGMPMLITKEEFYQWFNSQERKCHYCDLVDLSLDSPLSKNKMPITFTVDRMDSRLPYSVENIVMACWTCNDYKGAIFSHDEWLEIAQKYMKQKWMKKLETICAS